MKKRFFQLLSAMLAVCLLLTAAPLSGFVGVDLFPKAQAYAMGDHIQYGNYPQSRVTDTSLIADLDAAPKTWKSYRYYSGTGSWSDGKMAPSDYMQFADFFYGGNKYRAVTFSAYRPYGTGYTQSVFYSFQDYNGYAPNRIYYFLYEPVSWRILNPADGLILSEMIMDAQAYQNTVYANTENWQDTSASTYASDYATSSIRDWLNYDFYETAFTDAQKNNIRNDVWLNNDSPFYSAYSSASTKDKIFLLSYDEAKTASYGFSSDANDYDVSRRARGTDYAQCQGLSGNRSSGSQDNGFSDWWLRSPFDPGNACSVSCYGDFSYSNINFFSVNYTFLGVRAACRLANLQSDISQSQNLFSESHGGIFSGISDSCKIPVNNNSVTMALGDKKVLSVSIDNPKKQKLLYSSSDPSVVSVSVVGVVTAKSLGTATITVQTYDKQNSVTCEIEVVKNPEASISLSSSSFTMNIGETKKLNAICNPSGLSLQWTSSNNAVVTVDKNGLVKATGEGSAIVTVTVKDAELSASATVTVKKVNVSSSDTTDKVIKKNINKASEASKGYMEVVFDPQWFSGDSKDYNHGIAEFASEFATIGYSGSAHIKDALAEMGFPREKIKVEKKSGRDEQNYFFAHKPMKINGREYVLLFVGMIGSEGEQWNSDFDPLAKKSSRSDPTNDLAYKTHLGFMDAKNYVKEYLDKYYDYYHLNPDNTLLLITGHSRGAAAANLFAAEAIEGAVGTKGYIKYANLENIYAYTFATPSAVYSEEPETELRAEKYDRIYNIVNPEDFVTWMMPSAWHYGRYGQVIVLPSKDNCPSESVGNWNEVYPYFYNKMTPYYSKLTGGDSYQSFGGEYTVYSIIEKMTKAVSGLDDYYHKPLRTIIRSTTSPMGVTYIIPQDYNLFQYFQDVLCPFVNDQKMQIPSAVTLLPKFASGDDVLSSLTGFFFKNNVLNQCFAHAHLAETYCAFMESMKESEIVDASGKIIEKKRGYFKFRCPVDISVIDPSSGECLAAIINNIPSENNIISTYVEGDSKTVVLPLDSTYEILITGNDDGYLDYTYFEINQYGEEVNRINYFNVPVENDMVMSESTVYDDDGTGYSAIFNGCGEEIGTPQTVAKEDFGALTVTAETEGIGYVSGAGQYTAGDYVTLTAGTDENNSFLGWYLNGEQISTELTYSFVVKDNTYVTAKFTDVTVELTAIDVEVEPIDLATDAFGYVDVTFTPENATNRAVTFTSSDENVAKVSEAGFVEGVSPGITQITVTSDDGKISKTVTVTVTCSHMWDEGEITKPATPTQEGEKTFTCTVCNATYTEPIEKLPEVHTHDAGEWVIVTAATCLTAGTRELRCTGCGDVLKTEPISATGHAWGNWTKLNETQHQRICENDDSHVETEDHDWQQSGATDATCISKGTITYTCSKCNAAKTETGEYVDHNYGAWIEEIPAKCEETGVKGHFHCVVCDKNFDADKNVLNDLTIPQKNHAWGEWTTLNDEQHQRVCGNDASHVETGAHIWNDGEITKPATPTKEGEKTFTCTVCGATRTEKVGQLPGAELIDTDTAKEIGENLYLMPEHTAAALVALAGEGAKLEKADGSTVKGNEIVGSGMTLTKDDGTKLTLIIKGDNDGDGMITAADARYALRVAVSLETPNDWQLNASIVTGGDKVTAADARAILRAAVGLEDLKLT